MNWFLVGLIPPALWSITNHLDKYLLSKYFKGEGVGALMVFSSLIGLFLLPFIYFLNPNIFNISLLNAVLISINGFFYVLAVLPYFYALERDEASIIVPLFQLMTPLSYLLAYFVLGETLTTLQIIAGILVIAGAVGISLETVKGKVIRIKKDVLGLMFLSSLLFTLNFLFFKFFAQKTDFWTTAFWEYVGFAVFALILMVFVRPYRIQFVDVMKKNRIPVIALNGLNELINIVAKVSFNFASLLAPITLIWVVNGTQPFFVFFYGILITLFLPKLGKESLAKEHLIQKILSIIVMGIGTYLLAC
ncbi:EamA family transporter [Patescibacteria group bacterium]|nr:EamA family transporter [Patescibacteria group bacterium]MBU2035843.1 EamA family transporter [Patescibacteria group bacterium]